MNFKKILSIILTLVLTMGICPTVFATEDIPEGFTPIYTADDLNNIRNNISGKYILMNDIDLSVYENWKPVGTMTEPFTGSFDGNGYTIKNLTVKSDISTEETNSISLFGFIKNASIADVSLDDISLRVDFPYTSTYFIGAVASYCIDSKIALCDISGSISVLAGGSIFAGGIAGSIFDENKSTEITNCTSKVDIDVIGEDKGFWSLPEEKTYVGGVVGNVNSANRIYKCTNTGDICVSSIKIGRVGCIAGNVNDTEISKCYNTGKVTAEGTCEITENPLETSLWSRILFFFSSIFERIANIFKQKGKAKMNKTFKRMLSIIFAIVIILSAFYMLPVFATVRTTEQLSEVPSGYVGIYNSDDINAVRNNLGGKYILMRNIDISSENWNPIGDRDNPFNGVFNGNGYEIKNLNYEYINGENVYLDIGFFGVAENAVISNLTLSNVKIKVYYPAQIAFKIGAIAATSLTTNVINCSSDGEIDITSGGDICIGGIIGNSVSSGNTLITNCLSETKLKAKTEVGFSIGFPTQMYTLVGGIIGTGCEKSRVTKCINKGDINVIGDNNIMLVGGIAGNIITEVVNCGNIGEISVKGKGYAGGICGSCRMIENSYNAAKVILSDDNEAKQAGIGGVAGCIESNDTGNILSNEIINCYYSDNNEKSVYSIENGVEVNAQALTDDELIKQQSYEGFDFENIWSISTNNMPTIHRKKCDIETHIEIIENEYYIVPVELFALKTNNEIVAIIENDKIKGRSEGTTSVDIITSDGQFEIIEATVLSEKTVCKFEYIIDRIIGLLNLIFQKFVSCFNDLKVWVKNF